MRQNNCIFCKFNNDPALIKSQIIIKTKDFFVMLTANPQTVGHSLVIPSGHFDNLLSLPKVLREKLFSEAIKIGELLKSVLGAKAYVIKINNELYKLEINDKNHVGHIHFHIIPRYKSNEKIKDRPKKASAKSLILVQKKLRSLVI